MNPNKAFWEQGDSPQLAASMRADGQARTDKLGIVKIGLKNVGEILEIEGGYGTMAIPGAQLVVNVLDAAIASHSVRERNERFTEAWVTHCRFAENGACDLHSIRDQSFDLVVSIFGAMFASNPLETATEMVRVTRPGGKIVMGNLIPGDATLATQVLKISSAYTPQPRRFISPLLWGVEEQVVGRFGLAGIPKAKISFVKDMLILNIPYTPSRFVATFRKFHRATAMAFEAAKRAGKDADLQRELEDLFEKHNQSEEANSTSIPTNFLRVTVQC